MTGGTVLPHRNRWPRIAPNAFIAPGSTVIGEAGVERAIHSAMPGVAVTNPLTAAKARLTHPEVVVV